MRLLIVLFPYQRTVSPLILECLKGRLNHDNLCEHITAEPPKAVCSPGFFESDGLCIQRREAPCEADSGTEPASYITKSGVFLHEKQEGAPSFHSKVTYSNAEHEQGKKSSRWETLRQDLGAKFVASDESVELYQNVDGVPKGTQEIFPSAGFESAFDFGLDESAFSISYGETEGQPFGHQWQDITEGPEYAPNEFFSDVFPEFVRRRRLKASVSQPDQDALAERENAAKNRALYLPPWNSNAEHHVANENSQEESPHSKDASTRSHLRLPFVNPVGLPYAGPTSVMTLMNQKLLYSHNKLANPIGTSMKPSVRPAVWHDHRFDSPIGSERGPFARQQQNSAYTHGEDSREPGISQKLRSVLQRPSIPLSRQSTNVVDKDASANPTVQLNGTPSEAHATNTVLGEYRYVDGAANMTAETYIASVEGRQASRLQGVGRLFTNNPQKDPAIGARTLMKTRVPSESHTEVERRLRGGRGRRLEGLDYIPGCWEVSLSFWCNGP